MKYPTRLRDLRRTLLLFCARSLSYIASLLPWRVQYLLGTCLGHILLRYARRRRHIAEINIAHCFPKLSPKKRARLLRENFHAYAIALFECANAWNPGRRRRIYANCQLSNMELLQKNAARKGGGIVICPHSTTLELAGPILNDVVPVTLVYRRLKNEISDILVKENRARCCQYMFERSEIRAVIRTIRQGGLILLFCDQDYGEKVSVYAPFFGKPACTITSAFHLHKLVPSSRLFFGQYLRLGRQEKYQINILPAPNTIKQALHENDQEKFARAMNRELEKAILLAPEQYFWLHRRFKNQPPNYPPIYG